ncbi:hypothetical protein PG985_002528 [Apiospora marii]|uniref:Metallo-beta-lactamase domain-containing protein n=1 Tax=Apiospora marii TaxID=335849 RepID=A0ABR1RTJ0_9PEZI
MADSPSPSSRPPFQFPASPATVDVRVIDTYVPPKQGGSVIPDPVTSQKRLTISSHSGTRLYLKPGVFWEPTLPGFEGPDAPVYTFLISRGERHVLFDLGVRADWENLPPRIVEVVQATTRVTGRGRDVASVLDDDAAQNRGDGPGPSVRSVDIEAIIWSHSHFDHVGDPSRFPPSTSLVVGPGVPAVAWPGYPSDPNGTVLDSDAAGRAVREISFTSGGAGGHPLRIGRFNAVDYFGDGSFYLLNAPGHAPGHMCGLARTTAEPPTFVFMGGDACHHAGVIRPSAHLPLPPSEARQVAWKVDTCAPFFEVARNNLFPDYAAATETVAKIQELDACDNVFVVLSHDDSLGGRLPLFPDCVNEWHKSGLREGTRWLFCKEFESVKA